MNGARDPLARWRVISLVLCALATVLCLSTLVRRPLPLRLESRSLLAPDELAQLTSRGDPELHDFLLLAVPSDAETATATRLKEGGRFRWVRGPADLQLAPPHNPLQLPEGRALLIGNLKLDRPLNPAESTRLVEEVKRSLEGVASDPWLLGQPVVRATLAATLWQELLWPGVLVVLGLILFPLWVLRSWQLPLFAAVGALFAVSITAWAYVSHGAHLTYLSFSLLPILLCLNLLDSTFLIFGFQESRRKGGTPAEAAQAAVRKRWIPCTLTSLTTLLGFGTLAWVSETPVLVEYGQYASLGILLGFVVNLWVAPFWYPLARGPAPARRQMIRPRWLRRVAHRPRTVVAAFGLCTLVALPFCAGVNLNTVPHRLFSSSHPLQSTMDHLAHHLGSLSPFLLEVEPKAPKSTLEVLAAAHGLAAWLKAESLAKWAFSPTTGRTEGAGGGGFRSWAELTTRVESHPWREWAEKSDGWLDVDQQGRVNRVRVLAFPSQASQEGFGRLGAYLDNFERTMMEGFRLRRSGFYWTFKSAEGRLLRESLRSLAIALVLVLLVVSPLWKSWGAGTAFLAVNLFPLVVVGGAMGALGIPFQVSLASLPGVLFGLAVDDSIHLLWASRGQRPAMALSRCWRPMAASSALLLIAFGGLWASDLLPHRHYGMLACAGVVAALMADLFLLPALLAVIPASRRSLPSWRKRAWSYPTPSSPQS